jgi:hypothetical protein
MPFDQRSSALILVPNLTMKLSITDDQILSCIVSSRNSARLSARLSARSSISINSALITEEI